LNERDRNVQICNQDMQATYAGEILSL